jgi:hypothetical protein
MMILVSGIHSDRDPPADAWRLAWDLERGGLTRLLNLVVAREGPGYQLHLRQGPA